MAQPFDHLERQRSRLLGLAGLLLTLTCATLLLVTWSSQGVAFDFSLAQRWPTLVGLGGLVLIFVFYGQAKHRELAALERRLREMAVREAAMQARFSELSFLFDTSTQLQLRLDLGGMLELAVQRLVPCLDAHQASIMLFDESNGMLEVRAVAGVDSGLVAGSKVKPGDGIAGHVFTSGETLLLTPEVMRERFPEWIKQGRTIGSAVCAPMRFRGSTIGVVSVSRGSGEPFQRSHAEMLGTFAEHCAATVVKTHHHQQVLAQVRKAA